MSFNETAGSQPLKSTVWRVYHSFELRLRCLWLPALHFKGLSCLVTFSRTMVSLHRRQKHTRSLALARQHLREKKHQMETKNHVPWKKCKLSLFYRIFWVLMVSIQGVDRDLPRKASHPASILAMPKQTRAKVSFTHLLGLGRSRYV